MPPHSLSPGVNSGVQSVENAPSASNTVPPHVFTATARTQAHVENPNPDRSTLLILSESAFTTNGICRARSPPTFQASEPVKGSKTSGNPSEWIVSPLDKSSNWTVRVRSVVQFAAQPAPPKVTQCWHVPSEHSALLEQTCSARGPPMHTPSPIQSDFPLQVVPAFAPPMHVPPLSQSSPASITPLPQPGGPGVGELVGVAVALGIGVTVGVGIAVEVGISVEVGTGRVGVGVKVPASTTILPFSTSDHAYHVAGLRISTGSVLMSGYVPGTASGGILTSHVYSVGAQQGSGFPSIVLILALRV